MCHMDKQYARPNSFEVGGIIMLFSCVFLLLFFCVFFVVVVVVIEAITI